MDSISLLREIEDSAARLGIKPSTLCHKAVRNSKLPTRLRSGSVTVRTVNKVRAWIADEIYRRDAERLAS